MATWQDSRDLLFEWTLPSGLAAYHHLLEVEVRFERGPWITITSGEHVNMELDPDVVGGLPGD